MTSWSVTAHCPSFPLWLQEGQCSARPLHTPVHSTCKLWAFWFSNTFTVVYQIHKEPEGIRVHLQGNCQGFLWYVSWGRNQPIIFFYFIFTFLKIFFSLLSLGSPNTSVCENYAFFTSKNVPSAQRYCILCPSLYSTSVSALAYSATWCFSGKSDDCRCDSNIFTNCRFSNW